MTGTTYCNVWKLFIWPQSLCMYFLQSALPSLTDWSLKRLGTMLSARYELKFQHQCRPIFVVCKWQTIKADEKGWPPTTRSSSPRFNSNSLLDSEDVRRYRSFVLTLNKNNKMTTRNEWLSHTWWWTEQSKATYNTFNDLYRTAEDLRNAWAHQVITTGRSST